MLRTAPRSTITINGRNVHDNVAHGDEDLRRLHLSEEVREVLRRFDEGHTEFVLLDQLANEEVSTIDVFRSLVVLWVVRQVTHARR